MVAALIDLVLSIEWWGLARLMNGERVYLRQSASLENLMEAGRRAFASGERRLAHDLWREAAIVDPYNESVWESLFGVLETDEDRLGCLQNIIAINPLNVEARRQLRRFRRQTQPRSAEPTRPSTAPVKPVDNGLGTFFRALFAGVGIGLMSILIGVIASIIVYGM